MSKQVRMACALLDNLLTSNPLTAVDAAERIDYDINSIREALNVLVQTHWAEIAGMAPDGRTKLFVPGPKLRGGA